MNAPTGFRLIKVCFDGTPKVEALTDETDWNGFANVLLTEEQAKTVFGYLDDEGDRAWVKREGDELVISLEASGDTYRIGLFPGTDLFDFRNAGFAFNWHEIDEEEEVDEDEG